MKDYSKVKFVKSPVDAFSYDGRIITKGKLYTVIKRDGTGLFEIKHDNGRLIFIYIHECNHLDGKNWIPCDENGKELTND